MDNSLGITAGGQGQVLKAYGLVYSLLSNGVRVHWSYSTSKSKDGNDFTCAGNQVKRRSTAGVSSADVTLTSGFYYRASQFIVLVEDTAVAGPQIRAFANQVTVHQVLSDFSNVPVQQTLTQVPKAYIEDRTSGNTTLITTVLTNAGIPSSAYTTASSGVPSLSSLSGTGSGCYTVYMIPHEDNMTSGDVSNLKAFLDDGGNVYLQCHAVQDFENLTSNPARVLTTTGISSQSEASTYIYPDAGARMSIGQFFGTFDAVNGSVTAWKLPNGGSYQAGSIPVVRKSNDATFHKVMAIRKDNDPSKGLLITAGGHDYNGHTNPSRVLLNAFFTPSQRFGCTPLPVELTSFSAHVVDANIQLRWRTSTEKNNFGFEVERRVVGREWMSVTFVNGFGTVNTPQNYSYEDRDALRSGSAIQYRLKQIDRDGTFSYSAIVEVRADGEMPVAAISGFSPNPAVGSTAISFSLSNESPVSITVYDMMGREQVSVQREETIGSGTHVRMIDLAGVTAGTYYVMLRAGSKTSTAKLVVGR
jgi:hypothetical protein